MDTVKCTRPMTAYRKKGGHTRYKESGKWPITFSKSDAHKNMEVVIPCGKCIGCRLEKSRQWAVRCVNEASCWEQNCFITLTYNNKNIPISNSISKKVVQLFIKRLRKKYKNKKIRYFLCGEYGEKFSRPHYHICLFNFDFPDKELYYTKKGTKLYVSNILVDLWPFGYSTVGDVTFESAAYVARYITKKITGEIAEEHYKGKEPEFCLMSRRPGIGRYWLDKWKDDLKSTDRVIVRSDKKISIPKYYNEVLEKEDKENFDMRRKERRKNIVHMDIDKRYTLDKDRIIIQNSIKRRLENGNSISI